MFLTGAMAQLRAQQSAPPGVTVGDADLGGVVTGPNGPEAGVWVIAETTDLPTKFAKIVVTDDQGRYVIPDLPKANYNVWVRGYGLVDSPKVQAAPGKILEPDRGRRAERRGGGRSTIRPATGTRCCKIPAKSEFPGTGPNGNGISENMKSQADWLDAVKTSGCKSCHRSAPRRRARSPEDSERSRTRSRPGRAACMSGQAMAEHGRRTIGRLGPAAR